MEQYKTRSAIGFEGVVPTPCLVYRRCACHFAMGDWTRAPGMATHDARNRKIAKMDVTIFLVHLNSFDKKAAYLVTLTK